MEKIRCYENYPVLFVFICNLFSLIIYALGIYIILQIGLIWIIPYVVFILFLEYSVLKHSCRYCFYYGKYCAFGKGKLCKLFFEKQDPKIFINKKITWKSLIPDFLVFLIPLIIGVILLILNFKLTLLIILILLFVLGFIGNAFIRGSLACKYCKQRELGCPAQKFFSKK